MADAIETSTQLEQDITRIERELIAKREVLRQQQEGSPDQMPHDKETLHEVVGEMIRPTESGAPQGLPSVQVPTVVTPPSSGNQTTVLPTQMHQQIQSLVNVAFDKSITEAIKDAKMTNNAALIDAFHDILVYDHLVERGKLKRF